MSLRTGVWLGLAIVAGCAVGCAPLSTADRPGQPAGWDDGVRATAAEDLNPDPNIVEVALDARPAQMSFVPGGATTVFTYDGLMPGPLIRARVGNRVIVHFTNSLPEATTIHWHGLRIPAAMDGMPDLSQPPVQPGGSFDYDFVVPDASTFWYHPHVNSAVQEGNGMNGAFIVDDPAEPAGLGDEVVMVLSDIGVNDDGSLYAQNAGGDVGTLFGREGNILLVNGMVKPTLKARPGLRQRWRFINAAKTRYFQIGLDGHSFTRIGGDGGLLSVPVEVAEPEIAPGERMDLLVVPDGEPGSQLMVRWIAFDRGYGSTFNRPPEDLFVVDLEGSRLDTPAMPAVQREIAPLVPTAPQIDLELMEVSTTPFALGINGAAFKDAAPVMAYVGDTQVWSISNNMDFAHPFHLHGFFFQVISPAGPLEWKDTVNVPVGGTVQFVTHYDDRPGMWMFHCHILDHAEAGMMGSLMVMEP